MTVTLLPLSIWRWVRWPLALAGDVVLWGLVVAAALAILHWLDIDGAWPAKRQTLTLKLSDANALVAGSDVRLMGVPVGIVQSTRMLDDDRVEIVFTLQPDTPPIPANARATVAFSGLGGSKSVEFEVPANTETAQALASPWPSPYRVETPIRISDALQYQLDTAIALQHGAEGLTSLLDKYPLSVYQKTVTQSVATSNATARRMQEIARQAPIFVDEMTRTTNQIKTVMQEFNRNSAALNRRVLDPGFQRSTRKSYLYVRDQAQIWQDKTRQIREQLDQGTLPYQQALQQADQRIGSLKQPLPHLLQQKQEALEQASQRLDQLDCTLSKATCHLQNLLPVDLAKTRLKTQSLERQTRQADQQLEELLAP